MRESKAEAVWTGNLREGKGEIRLGTGAYVGPYSFASRFETGSGTNPEELIGAAHAGCFTMAFSATLVKAGYKPGRLHTVATVHMDTGGPKISLIELALEAEVPGLDEAAFQKLANEAKVGCPVSQALAAVEIHLQAKLLA